MCNNVVKTTKIFQNALSMKKILAVMSGKGGVGKSSIAVLIAQILSEKYKVMLLDFDICGPSVTSALNINGSLIKTENGFEPVKVTETLSVVSFGSILGQNDAVIWRGPKKLAFLELFFNSADECDYVVIDTPPGISEEHEFLSKKDIYSFIVTTPQNISLNDAQRCIEFCLNKNINILGVLENMSGLKCECCNEIFYPLGSKGGKQLADEYGINFLGSMPIDPSLSISMDDGSFRYKYDSFQSTDVIKSILYNVIGTIFSDKKSEQT